MRSNVGLVICRRPSGKNAHSRSIKNAKERENSIENARKSELYKEREMNLIRLVIVVSGMILLPGQFSPADSVIPNQRSKGAPAAAVFSGQIHMVHQGDKDNQLWHTRFNGTRWTKNVKIPDQKSRRPPALAKHANRLYMVHAGNKSDRLYYSYCIDNRWRTNQRIGDFEANGGYAIASFQGGLHLVFVKNWSLYHSVLRNGRWSKKKARLHVNGTQTPSLVVFRDRLHLLYRNSVNNLDGKNYPIYERTFDGNDWSDIVFVSGLTKTTVGVGEFNGRLEMVHLGGSRNDFWTSSYVNGDWTVNQPIAGKSQSAPALVKYKNNIWLIYRGNSTNKLYYRVHYPPEFRTAKIPDNGLQAKNIGALPGPPTRTKPRPQRTLENPGRAGGKYADQTAKAIAEKEKRERARKRLEQSRDPRAEQLKKALEAKEKALEAEKKKKREQGRELNRKRKKNG